MSELEANRQQLIDQHLNEQVLIAEDINREVQKTKAVGVDITSELDRNGGELTVRYIYFVEQIKRIGGKLDEVDMELNEAGVHLDELQTVCCCIKPFWKRKEMKKAPYKQYKGQAKNEWDTKGNYRITVDNKQHGDTNEFHMEEIVKGDEREKEIHGNLYEASRGLKDIRDMAVRIGADLTEQNQALDELNGKMQNTGSRVGYSQTRAEQVLNKKPKPTDDSVVPNVPVRMKLASAAVLK